VKRNNDPRTLAEIAKGELSRDGVIRFKNVRGDELDRAVASLASESPPGKAVTR
jgi:hypothetical protein